MFFIVTFSKVSRFRINIFLSVSKTCSGSCHSPSFPNTLILIKRFHSTHSPNAPNFIQRIPRQVLVSLSDSSNNLHFVRHFLLLS
jgi:hypothetical protein